MLFVRPLAAVGFLLTTKYTKHTNAGAGIGCLLLAWFRIHLRIFAWFCLGKRVCHTDSTKRPCCFEKRKTTGQQGWSWILNDRFDVYFAFVWNGKYKGNFDAYLSIGRVSEGRLCVQLADQHIVLGSHLKSRTWHSEPFRLSGWHAIACAKPNTVGGRVNNL